MQTLLDCEHAYTRLFCAEAPFRDGARFRDALLPDMYDHNFTYLAAPLDANAFSAFSEAEILRCREEGLAHCKITTAAPPAAPLALFRQDRLGFYRLEDELPHAGASCIIRPLKTRADASAYLAVNLAYGRANPGQSEDFIRRKTARRLSVCLAGGMDLLLAFTDGAPVGQIEVFVHDGVAKLENFFILPACQRQNIGSALLTAAIAHAKAQGAHTLYLVADENDTPRLLYERRGFVRAFVQFDHLLLFAK